MFGAGRGTHESAANLVKPFTYAGFFADAALAPGGRHRGGAHDPAAEGGEVALLGPERAIDQVPAHALGHRQRKRRDQPAGGEVVVDIGADAHGDAEPVDGGLQRLAVELELRSARGDAADARGLQPGRPVVRRMRDAQAGSAPSGRPDASAPRRVLGAQTGRRSAANSGSATRPGQAPSPSWMPQLQSSAKGAAAPPVVMRTSIVGLLLAEIRQPRDQPAHREGRADADGEHAQRRGAVTCAVRLASASKIGVSPLW